MTTESKVRIALADDHKLLRNALAQSLEMEGFEVVAQSDHGEELIQELSKSGREVDLVLLDFSMPVMNGIDTCDWLRKNRPDVKVLAISSYSDENAVLGMIRAGARGYVIKDAEPRELRDAIHAVMKHGFHHTDFVSGSLLNAARIQEAPREELSDREVEFLKLVCEELTYREIAEKLGVAARTVDNYRDSLFAKLGVRSRVGLVVYAIKHRIFRIDPW